MYLILQQLYEANTISPILLNQRYKETKVLEMAKLGFEPIQSGSRLEFQSLCDTITSKLLFNFLNSS